MQGVNGDEHVAGERLGLGDDVVGEELVDDDDALAVVRDCA